jgi:hypothetical protein
MAQAMRALKLQKSRILVNMSFYKGLRQKIIFSHPECCASF